MKYLFQTVCLSAFAMLASCSSNNEPEPDKPVLKLLSSISSVRSFPGSYPTESSETFLYDDLGRIVKWEITENSPERDYTSSTRYEYPDKNTIKIVSEEVAYDNTSSYFEDVIYLSDGIAEKSKGTFIQSRDGEILTIKTVGIEFVYNASGYLSTVKNSEIYGTEGSQDSNWSHPWEWENNLEWKDGVLVEFHDYAGSSLVFDTIKYNYSEDVIDQPVVIPIVTGRQYHYPLLIQGVFGPISHSLLISEVRSNKYGICSSRRYSYDFEGTQIGSYVQSYSKDQNQTFSVSNNLTWTTHTPKP